MNRLVLVGLCLAGCRHPQATYPALPVPCRAERVGKVTIQGGTASDVPQLAVLEGTLDNPARTERIAQASAELLKARGYARASVTVTRRQSCGVELEVAVSRGPKFRIKRIDFDTTDELPAATRLAALEDALGTINSIGGAFVADRLERALGKLARRYHEAGWLEAEIDPPRAMFDADRGTVDVEIPIRPGRRYKIGNVVARGGRRATRAAVIEALGLVGGQYYDAARVREGIVRARQEIDDRLELRMQIDADRIDLEAIVGDDR